jgi:GNAT superfamily N-acetyltransferase
MQCFVGSDVYGDPVVCKKNLDPTIRYYDSGFMVEVQEGKEDKIVGFMSIHHDVSYKSRTNFSRKQQNLPPQQDDYHAFILYNVCIDEEKRGQGVAKKMIPQFIDELIRHYRLERYANSNGRDIDPQTGHPIPPLLVGLDVDLTSDTMPEAFSLYAKLGFVRWWTPCTSVANHKWTSLIDAQMNYAKDDQSYGAQDRRDENGNVKKSTGLLPTHNGDFPIAQMLWDPNPYLKNAFNLGSSTNRPSHFCMYKFYQDSYGSLAKSLLDYSASQK